MFKNNFKTALRFLNENIVFAGINVLGLSIALTTLGSLATDDDNVSS